MKEVEKFRLTKETLAFQRAYKKLKKVTDMLQMGMQQTLQKGASYQQLMEEATGQMNQLLMAAPQKPVRDLLGQDEEAA